MPDGKTKADDVPDPALAAFELSARLVLAGRYEEALTATDEAARLYRERITDPRTGPRETLGAAASRAYVLVFRCEALSKLGRWEECLRTASEAVALSRSQQADAPFAAPLGATLMGLATALWGLGRPQEALAMAREAVGLYRRLARVDAAYRPQLANVLNLLGVVLSRLGLHAEALKVTKESVVLYRRLTSADPAAHTLGLAQAVNNLARRRSVRNHGRRALRSAQEAVTLYRQLARDNPAVHRRDVAMALGNLARAHFSRDASLAAAQESVAILRDLDQGDPRVHGALLADALSLLAAALADLGRLREAAEVTTQALAMMREQAAINPVARRGDLALALAFHARVRAEAGTDLAEGLAAATEAVGLMRELAAELPQMYASSLAEVRALEDRLRALAPPPGA
ncbi:tetratricopeptide repeat protein [Streptomyces sp. NBC_01207]|uniref:tetratricopeptide repeat protein n=1 Tax=Streptomyces sp. NBC_01207 TaxID=2903772 RepID=UPI002E120A19|nr:tetratricopeptide repeat protein [Streptomyces sp. NBC_01207]